MKLTNKEKVQIMLLNDITGIWHTFENENELLSFYPNFIRFLRTRNKHYKDSLIDNINWAWLKISRQTRHKAYNYYINKLNKLTY